MSVYFHANFGLNRSRMAGLLKQALNNPNYRDEELAKPFGYHAPFAQKYRSWLNKAGIIDLDFPVRLMPKGQVVWEKDPNFETLTTQWFIHWELTQSPDRAEAWHFFIHEFLPTREEFTVEELIHGLMLKLRAHSEKHFGPGSILNPVIARKLVECYTETNALGVLGIVRKKDSAYTNGRPETLTGPWKDLIEFQAAYSL